MQDRSRTVHRPTAEIESKETFAGSFPDVWELIPAPSPVTVFRALCQEPHCVFLDSAVRDRQRGRFSYVAADPFAWIVDRGENPRPLDTLRENLQRCSSVRVEGLPAFQGGAIGMLAYDLAPTLERLPSPRCVDFQLPRLAMGLYDILVAFDHEADRAWIVSQGWPETDPQKRLERARRRRVELLERILSPRSFPHSVSHDGVPHVSAPRPSSAADYPQTRWPGVYSDFAEEEYLKAVERAIEYIHAGDIFQVNLAQRLQSPAHTDSVSLYLRMRELNPAPFAGYFDLGDFQLVSASPERFLRVEEGWVETRPIKGTRRRAPGVEADLFVGDDLRHSEKDLAENVMIVDLMRNDLSRVCLPDSVEVTQLCQVETYQFVQHLVSAVVGRLRPECDEIDLIRATFPGGSITGAPKIRAMEIVAEIERHARGAYCGSLGYLGWDGTMDLNILIRTITAGYGWWQLPVGGGIVADSEPRREYDETWHKAEGLLRSLLPVAAGSSSVSSARANDGLRETLG